MEIQIIKVLIYIIIMHAKVDVMKESISMKPYIKGKHPMTTTDHCVTTSYFLVVIM